MRLRYFICGGLAAVSLISCGKDDIGKEGSGDVMVVSPEPSCPVREVKMTLYPSRMLGVMEGFGASDCWLPAQIGKYWTANRDEIARLLFSRDITDGQPEGIGMSQWRVNLGAGSAEQGDASDIPVNNRAECFLAEDSDDYDWNKCEGQRWFMEEARKYGCESFVLFSNSPLVRWTINGKAYAPGFGYANLKLEHFKDFAGYMADVAMHFRKQGFNISHISPVNEPQHNWDGTFQEGSSWKNFQIANLVRELDKALTESGCDTRILIPEAASWTALCQVDGSSDRSDQIRAFFNPSSDTYVGDLAHVDKIAAGHSYWTFDNWTDMREARGKAASAAADCGIRLWQTEWSMLDREPSEIGMTYDEMSEFDIALYMSKVIHNDLTVGGCTSWAYWTAMSVERYSQKNRFELIKVTPSGGNYSDDFTSGGTVTATDNLWVLGNYSRFVRPGFRRIAIECPESSDFFASAYVSGDMGTTVIVVTNCDRENGVRLELERGTEDNPKSVWRYTTTSGKHLKGEEFAVGDRIFVEPCSVSTFVIEN